MCKQKELKMIKRNYKKFITAFFLVFALLSFSQNLIFAELTTAGQEGTASDTAGFSRIEATYNPDCNMVIETAGDTVKTTGKITRDHVRKIYILGTGASSSLSEDFKSASDGSFSSEITINPGVNGYFPLYIILESDKILSYRLQYKDGWSVPDNGLCKANAARLENVITAEPIAAAYYLSVTADKEEISQTLDKLKTIVDGVCAGETDDYKKAYLLFRWVAENIYYDHDAAATSVTLETVAVHNVLSTLRTTCAGFANTYSALLETAGIRSVNLKGAAAAGQLTYETLPTGRENHEFTAFWYEKEQRWAYADPCWGGAGDYKNGEFTNGIAYDKYFDITGEALALDHRVDKAEERHYLKALEAVEAGSPLTQAPISSTPEGSPSTEEADLTEDFPVTTQPAPKPIETGNIAPYIIIALMGVLIIGAGIILAINKRKK